MIAWITFLTILAIVLLACVVYTWVEERYPAREAIPTCYWKNPCGMCLACKHGVTESSLVQTAKLRKVQ